MSPGIQAAGSEFAEFSDANRPSRWPGYLMALAATSILIGIRWDISWHMSIGRDTFWTPAHMAIYFGGTLAGCICSWLAIRQTFFASAKERESGVNIFGARAPLGAWVAIWGAVAMLTSAPFDDWWHNAYGLDVKIISPPHSVLGLGMLGVAAGALLLTVARQNRERTFESSGLFIYVGGIFLAFGAVFISEFVYPNMQHTMVCYMACCLMLPLRLVTMGRAGRVSWSATRVAAVYMLLECLLVWILPLFPARPKLAPVFNPITHMVPPMFPLLLVIPAVGIDLFLQRTNEQEGAWRLIQRSLVLGAIFLGLLLVTQWFFAQFMLSPHADNWFFAGNRYWGYRTFQGNFRHQFWTMDRAQNEISGITVRGILGCWIAASFTSWLGLLWGGWMRKVKR